MFGIMNKSDIFKEEKLYRLHFGASSIQGVCIYSLKLRWSAVNSFSCWLNRAINIAVMSGKGKDFLQLGWNYIIAVSCLWERKSCFLQCSSMVLPLYEYLVTWKPAQFIKNAKLKRIALPILCMLRYICIN